MHVKSVNSFYFFFFVRISCCRFFFFIFFLLLSSLMSQCVEFFLSLILYRSILWHTLFVSTDRAITTFKNTNYANCLFSFRFAISFLFWFDVFHFQFDHYCCSTLVGRLGMCLSASVCAMRE